jgi:hypothetical protein
MLIMQVYHDSGRTSRLRSTLQLWTYLLTPVAHHGSGRWACRLSYHLSCERLRIAGLDDCSILQPKHLVGNRLGGTHDLISAQSLRSHSFACGSSQAMSHATKEHLAWRDLRKNLSIRRDSIPNNPTGSRSSNVPLVRWALSLGSTPR